MKPKELREKTDIELEKLIADERRKLHDVRLKVRADQHKDVREVRESRTLLARMLTVLREKKGRQR